LSSAIVSGVAMLILLYVVISKIRRVNVDDECLRVMMKLLWLFLILAVTLESLETLNMAYEAGEEWHMIYRLITEKLRFSFLYVQLLIGSAIPFVLLLVGWMKKIGPRLRVTLGTISSLLVLIQVLSMRFNVVIGGQMLSKSFRGFVDYIPEWHGREGIFVAIGVFTLPFILLTALMQILPVWKIDAHDH
jgi:predicted membrane protein